MLKYLHNFFKGEAERYYREKFNTQCGNYFNANRKWINHYNNINRQICMHQMLQCKTLSAIMSQHYYDTSVDLETLRDMITTYTFKGPMSYQTEEAMVEYLQNALTVVKRAKPALIKCYAHHPWCIFTDFILLYTPLGYEKSLQERTIPQFKTHWFFLDHNERMRVNTKMDFLRINIVITVRLKQKLGVGIKMNLVTLA